MIPYLFVIYLETQKEIKNNIRIKSQDLFFFLNHVNSMDGSRVVFVCRNIYCHFVSLAHIFRNKVTQWLKMKTFKKEKLKIIFNIF